MDRDYRGSDRLGNWDWLTSNLDRCDASKVSLDRPPVYKDVILHTMSAKCVVRLLLEPRVLDTYSGARPRGSRQGCLFVLERIMLCGTKVKPVSYSRAWTKPRKIFIKHTVRCVAFYQQFAISSFNTSYILRHPPMLKSMPPQAGFELSSTTSPVSGRVVHNSSRSYTIKANSFEHNISPCSEPAQEF